MIASARFDNSSVTSANVASPSKSRNAIRSTCIRLKRASVRRNSWSLACAWVHPRSLRSSSVDRTR
ncbi:hypothetical protein D3C83_303050 [compost metagenome]